MQLGSLGKVFFCDPLKRDKESGTRVENVHVSNQTHGCFVEKKEY
jgi:hypothetical protein